MPLDEALLRTAGDKLINARRVQLVSHKRPDGDAIGSLLGFGLALSAAGKDIQMVSVDGVPHKFRHLKGSEKIQKRVEGEFGLVCVLDCSDLSRTGGVLNGHPQPEINIDHHPTNLNFARINLVDVEAVATAQIIVDLLSVLGVPLTRPAAEALLTGLITDSLGFRTSNMSPGVLRLAADLMDLGCNLPELYNRALVERTFEAVRLWGEGLNKIAREGRLVWTALTIADRDSSGYSGGDDADLVNVLISVEQADIAVIFMEQSGEKVKVSWRSRPGFDVSGVASSFGGGGHTNAAGAEISGGLDDVQSAVIEATRPLLDENQN